MDRAQDDGAALRDAAAGEATTPVAGSPAGRGLPSAGKETRTATLSNGAVLTARPAIGRDLVKANQIANDDGPIAVSIALGAIVAKVDGKHFTYEDALEMEIPDVNALIDLVVGKGPFSVPAT